MTKVEFNKLLNTLSKGSIYYLNNNDEELKSLYESEYNPFKDYEYFYNLKSEIYIKNLLENNLISSKLLNDGFDVNAIMEKLTRDEYSSIVSYTIDSDFINYCCRNFIDDEITLFHINNISNAIDKFTLNKNVNLFRGIKSYELSKLCNFSQIELFDNSLDLSFWRLFEDLAISYKNFVSTSTKENVALHFTDRDSSIILVLNAKPDWKGINVSKISKYSSEEEVLLQRNSDFIIKNVEINKNTRKIYMEGIYELK